MHLLILIFLSLPHLYKKCELTLLETWPGKGKSSLWSKYEARMIRSFSHYIKYLKLTYIDDFNASKILRKRRMHLSHWSHSKVQIINRFLINSGKKMCNKQTYWRISSPQKKIRAKIWGCHQLCYENRNRNEEKKQKNSLPSSNKHNFAANTCCICILLMYLQRSGMSAARIHRMKFEMFERNQ